MWVLNGIMAKILLAVIWVLIAGRLGIVFATGNTGSTRWSSVDYVYVSSLVLLLTYFRSLRNWDGCVPFLPAVQVVCPPGMLPLLPLHS